MCRCQCEWKILGWIEYSEEGKIWRGFKKKRKRQILDSKKREGKYESRKVNEREIYEILS